MCVSMLCEYWEAAAKVNRNIPKEEVKVCMCVCVCVHVDVYVSDSVCMHVVHIHTCMHRYT